MQDLYVLYVNTCVFLTLFFLREIAAQLQICGTSRRFICKGVAFSWIVQI